MFKTENIIWNSTLWFERNLNEIIIGFFIGILTYIIFKKITESRDNFPPGPKGLPIVGYLPFLTKDTHLDLMELGKKFGDVFSIRFGFRDVVVLHGGDVIKESLNRNELLGRPPNVGNGTIAPLGIAMSNDIQYWKKQRKFMVKSLQYLGLGRTKIEKDIMEEISHFLETLKDQKSEPKDVKKNLAPSVSNNMYALLFGKRFEYDDPASQLLETIVDKASDLILQSSLDLAFPWLQYIPLVKKMLTNSKAQILYDRILSIFSKEVQKHMKTINPEIIRDVTDLYLIDIDEQRTTNQNLSLSHKRFASSALDFYFGGNETIQSCIRWFLYSMAAFPEVQQRVHTEISEIISPEKKIEFKDIKKMPYTHAVMMEILRWKTILPLSIVRYTLDDIIVGGYHLPKDTIVFINLWAVHHDPRYWTEPERMNPERFLSKDFKNVLKPDYFFPFSLGRRNCPGERMVYMEMFLYCTSIVREFKVVFPDGTEPTFDAVFVLVYRPKPFTLRFLSRN